MNDKKIVAVPFGNEYGLTLENHRGSTDIISSLYDYSGLRIVISTAPRGSLESLNLEFFFSNFEAFKIVEELSLTVFWESRQFLSHHHLYEIKSGGWLDEQNQSLSIAFYEGLVREWFIKTNNWSALVLSVEEPLIRELIK